MVLAVTPVERFVNEDFTGIQPWPFAIEKSAVNCAVSDSEINRQQKARIVLVITYFMVNGQNNDTAKTPVTEVLQTVFSPAELQKKHSKKRNEISATFCFTSVSNWYANAPAYITHIIYTIGLRKAFPVFGYRFAYHERQYLHIRFGSCKQPRWQTAICSNCTRLLFRL